MARSFSYHERAFDRREKRKEDLRQLFGGKCVECGSKESLRFHHIDPSTKLFNVTEVGRAWAKLVEEAEKCILLCEPCHRGGHNLLKHGYSAYIRHKCECEVCHQDYLRYWEEYRRKQGKEKRWFR